MKTQIQKLFLALVLWNASLAAYAQGTAFTYQGRLNENGVPTTGTYDLQFSLRDAAAGGNPVGGTNTIAPVSVSNGLFTVTLDFGANVFTGGGRWLEIGVKSNGVAGARTALTPMQRLTPSPYAIFAGGAQTATTVATGGAGPGSIAAGAVNSSAIADGTIQSGDLSAPLLNGTFWRLDGNTGVGNFLGTTDNQPLVLKVRSTDGLRIEPAMNNGGIIFPNLIGGVLNAIQAGESGSIIAGGRENSLQSTHAVISGGWRNRIQSGSFDSVIVGGQGNVISNAAFGASLGGGVINSIGAEAEYAMVGGGRFNRVGERAQSASISGGRQNSIGTNSFAATIGGGYQNTIDFYGINATISGGFGNSIQGYGISSTIAGGDANAVDFDAEFSTIGGGSENRVEGDTFYATIGGGRFNTVGGPGGSTVPGGHSNYAGGLTAFAAGNRAKANHAGSFVWADSTDADFASTAVNQFAIRATGGVRLSDSTPSLSFGATTRQMLNLWGTGYGIGVQASTFYSRCNPGRDEGFAWYKGGTHADGIQESGGEKH